MLAVGYRNKLVLAALAHGAEEARFGIAGEVVALQRSHDESEVEVDADDGHARAQRRRLRSCRRDSEADGRWFLCVPIVCRSWLFRCPFRIAGEHVCRRFALIGFHVPEHFFELLRRHLFAAQQAAQGC